VVEESLIDLSNKSGRRKEEEKSSLVNVLKIWVEILEA
jgi:hypothetical protein